jgi:TRAP-type mannitol/chloroaromatic compound transport system substrate-binding protein
MVFPTLGETPEPLGWFEKPIKSLKDLKGLKFRAAGLAAEVFKEMGMPVVSLAPGEIVPALERGTLDASEYSDPTSDMTAGLHEVRKYYHLPGIHQPTGMMDFVVNKKKFDELPADLRAIIEYACMAETLHYTVKMLDRNSRDLLTLVTEHGVVVVQSSREILVECLKAWDRVAERRAKKNPLFAKVLASQREFAKRLVGFRRAAHPPYDLAADYYWSKEDPYKVQKS